MTHTSSRSRRGGTVTHVPPENWKDINQERTVKYDVYSFAVLFWELLTEKTPYENGMCVLLSYVLRYNTIFVYCIVVRPLRQVT